VGCAPLALALNLLLPAAEPANPGCDALQAGTTAAARFRIGADGTVTDLSTGLTWQRCPVGTVLDDGGTPGLLEDDHCRPAGAQTFSWLGARLVVQRINAEGGRARFTDWRVPDLWELASIVTACGAGPAIHRLVFPDTPRSAFLSATLDEPGRGRAWVVDFLSGGETLLPKVTTLHLRLVRSAARAEASASSR
jgi:hypothetical protein